MTPRIGARQVVYENNYQQIYSVKVQWDDVTKTIYVNDYGERVGLLILRGDDALLVRQYRFLVNEVAWEIPGGKVDHGEIPEQAAVREGLEETCLYCRNLKPLVYFHPGLDTFDNPTHVFLTEDFEEAAPENLHKHEVIERVWVPVDQCLKMVFAKQIVDSLTIAALLAYHTRKNRPELVAP